MTAPPTTHPPDPAAAHAPGAEAAASLRRLQLTQMVALALIALALTAAVVAFFRVITVSEHKDRVIGTAVFRVAGAMEALHLRQAELRRFPTDPSLRRQVVSTAEEAAETLEEARDATDPLVDPATRRHSARTVEILDVALARGRSWLAQPRTAADPFAPPSPQGGALDASVRGWLNALHRDRQTAGRHLAVGVARTRSLMLGLIAGFALVVLGMWWRIGHQRTRVVRGLRRTSHEQAVMREIVTASTWADARQVAEVAVSHVATLTGASHVTAEVRTPDAVTTVSFPLHGVPHATSAMGDATRVRAEALGRACDQRDDHTGRTALSVPGETTSAACAALTVVWGPDAAVPDDAVAMLERIVSTLELALHSVEGRERLATQTVTDALTGLPNHRRFQELLAAEVSRAVDGGRPLSLAIIDVDGFSNVNDAYGHEAGDGVLTRLAARLRDVSREGDVLARIGGEEFAWLMPGVNAAAARAAADRARTAVRSAPVGVATQLTVSAGVVDLTHADDPKELMRMADIGLRQAKAAGADSVAIHHPGALPDTTDGARFGHLQSVSALRALARAVDLRDPTTQRHSERVAALTQRLALELGWSPGRAARLHEAALVHDVGKVGVPDAVLLKPGPLDDDERAVIETHPGLGARIVSEILDEEQVAWVRGHHERVDGTGYPDGLSGDALSEGARVMAVADTWDAMTSDRPYRRAMPSERALAIAVDVAGSQLDPDVVAALVRLHDAGAAETTGHDPVTGLHYGDGAPKDALSPDRPRG